MTKRVLLALAVLLLLALEVRAQDAITFNTTGSWTNATTCATCCSGGACGTLTADDLITVGSGATITVPTASTVSMTTGSITVQSGGVLTIAQRGNLAIPNAGLTVQSGGTFAPRGQAISYGDATPTLVNALSDGGGVDVNTAVPAGKIVHCPGVSAGGTIFTSATAIEPDCNGNANLGTGANGVRNQVAICWPNASVNAELLAGFDLATGVTGEQFYSQWVAQVAAGDVLVFWDSTNKKPSRDVNAQYEVAGINTTAANQCVVLDVRQGTTELSCAASAQNCDLLDRDIREITTAAAYTAGARTITGDAAAVTAASMHAGHNLTCPADKDANGTVEPGSFQQVTITETTAADVLRLMPGGLPYNVPNGSTCHIDYGWKTGDLISVYKPALLSQGQNATCVANDNPVTCCDGANFGVCGPIICSRGALCDYDFALQTRVGAVVAYAATTIDNSWMREISGNNQVLPVEGPSFTRLQQTSPAYAQSHGFVTGGGGTFRCTDCVLRHWGDDAFCANACTISGGGVSCDATSGSADTSLVHGFALRRLRAEYHGCAGGTCGVLDDCNIAGGGGGAIHYDVIDMLALDSQERVTTQGAIYVQNDETAGSTKMRNATMVASGGPLTQITNNSDSRIEARNFYDIGRVPLTANSTYPLVFAHTLTDASIVDANLSVAGTERMTGTSMMRANAGPADWKRVLWLDPDNTAATPAYMFRLDDPPAAFAVEDMAIISPNRTLQADANNMFHFFSSGANTNLISINRFTVAMRPGETNEFTGFVLIEGNDTTFNGGFRTMRNLLSAYVWRTAAGVLIGAQVTAGDEEGVVSPWCDENNSTAFNAAAQTALTSAVRDYRGQYVDAARGNFQPLKGSLFDRTGCGARKVGARDMWALRVLGHNIYNGYGDTWKIRGGGKQQRGPRATP